MTHILREQPALFVVVVLLVLAIANLPREIHRGRDGAAFLSSCATMLLLMALFGLGMFPHMVYSVPDAAHSLTVYNAASTEKTLKIMTLIAATGVPIVLSYTATAYAPESAGHHMVVAMSRLWPSRSQTPPSHIGCR
jgi:cytochrome d ubiquinol oxidase subunit II